ncbi:hypothetical protein MN202_18260 [Rheinheimera muenzenbergensis]|uniref:PBP domain-containing protein n=1 Tax=Rheinheimera muenzenbergensis TaxID=1193628 RepID=A0ABU8CB22_9GAMM
MKCLLLAVLVSVFPLAAATVLVHGTVPLDSLTQTQLRNIFTLRQTLWPDGTPVRVIVMPDSSAAHQRFCREQLRLFPYQLNNIWDKHSFSGTGRRPQQVDTSSEMLELLRTVPGAIGYAEQSSTDSAIKEVRID